MIERSIEIHPIIIKLMTEIESFKEELSKLLADREALIDTTGPNLEATYNIKIGQKEYELFCLQCDVRRLKRKIEIIQAALNRMETISLEKIEKQLDKEFKQWQEEMEKIYDKIKYSELRLSTLMSYEESIELKSLYKALIKKLHPDINDDLSESDLILWHKVNEAYKNGDLEELRVLSLLKGKEKIEEIKESDSKEELNNRRELLKKKVLTIMKDIENIKSKFPFDHEDLLNDDEWIKKQNQKIQQEINELNKYKKSLVEMLMISSPSQDGLLN